MFFLNIVVVSSLLFHPGALLKDTDGNIIRAHQPHVYNYSQGQGIQEVTSGHCKSAALLTSAAECQAAGKVLGLSGAVQTGSWGYIPPGCSWQDADNLWFNTNKASTHACQDGTDNGICLCVDSAQNDTKYYLLGSSQVGASAGTQGIVNLYTSTDLHSWQFEGGIYNHSGDSRPSLLGRNPRTGLYVFWAKGGRSFQSATSTSLTGPYLFNGSYVPEPSCTAGDSAAFLDPVSGNAYMVYSQHTCSGETNRAMKLLLLNDEWTAPASGSKGKPTSTVAGHLEAPCPFYSKLTQKHYIWCSHTSGWKPNAAELLVSDNGMSGPWNSLGNPSNNHTTFGTQGSHIEKLPDFLNPPGVERFLYVGDRYEPYIKTKEGSRYIFLAMEVHADGKVVLFEDQPWGLGDWPTI